MRFSTTIFAILFVTFLTACGMQSGPSSGNAGKPANTNLGVGSTPVPTTPPVPIFKRSVGGYQVQRPPSETLVAYRLDSDGNVSKVFADNSEKVIYKVEASAVAALKGKVDKISDAASYELKPDGSQAMLCDVYYKNELFVRGHWVATEEQKNCGTHDILSLKPGVTLPNPSPGDVSLTTAAHFLTDFVMGIVSLQSFLSQ